MRLTFFKNDNHDHPRITCLWTNAHKAELRKFPAKAYDTIHAVCISIPLVLHIICAFEFFNSFAHAHGIWVTLAVILLFYVVFLGFLFLLMHEFLHAVGAWISGKPVYAVRIFPHYQSFRDVIVPKYGSKTLGGLCQPDMCHMTKGQYLLFLLMPSIVQVIVPAVMAVFIPQIRFLLWMIATIGFATAAQDIPDSKKILVTVPRGAFYIRYNGWFFESDEPFIIDKIDTDSKTIWYERWQSYEGKLVQLPTPEPDERVTAVIGEFRRQFGIE